MIADGEDFAAADEGEGDLLADAGVGEAGDGGHGGDGGNDFRCSYYDSRTCAWKAEFGEAEGEDDVFVPVRFRIDEDDLGEG